MGGGGGNNHCTVTLTIYITPVKGFIGLSNILSTPLYKFSLAINKF